MRRLTVLLLIFSILSVAPIYGSKLDTKKHEADTIKAVIDASRDELEVTQEEKEKLEQEVKALDESIIQVEDDLYNINVYLDMKRSELDISYATLERAQRSRDVQYDLAKSRISTMYKNQKVGYIEVLFTSSDIWDMLSRMTYIRKVAEYDQVVLNSMDSYEEDVAIHIARVEAEEAEVEKLLKDSLDIKSKLDASMIAKAELIENYAANEAYLQESIGGLEDSLSAVEVEIQRLIEEQRVAQQYYSNVTGNGQLIWPVPGNTRISSGYGLRIHPIFKTEKFHTGIDIPAGYGVPVVAAASGRVITSGWVNGYGNTIMIDHGGGLVSLYAHNSSLIVSHGDNVEQGAQIAKIGSTGYSTGNHLHFEIRLNGSHVNTLSYL